MQLSWAGRDQVPPWGEGGNTGMNQRMFSMASGSNFRSSLFGARGGSKPYLSQGHLHGKNNILSHQGRERIPSKLTPHSSPCPSVQDPARPEVRFSEDA